ncbi:hypothetical protein DSCA_50620 [Desulfosarcina alkanivorans]|jgi:hypothetical protein|uniref:Uncharacterized protein n=1 Tax=Desulfosarcina alkanivorans TaxID=571177 RepID=A0A5K7YMY8_9BACT|nr:hypothetical protein DSCA_50620 [Desulfosarcina alkanivorans]
MTAAVGIGIVKFTGIHAGSANGWKQGRTVTVRCARDARDRVRQAVICKGFGLTA